MIPLSFLKPVGQNLPKQNHSVGSKLKTTVCFQLQTDSGNPIGPLGLRSDRRIPKA